jgi:outer membrane receptor protein involved in Fe transport
MLSAENISAPKSARHSVSRPLVAAAVAAALAGVVSMPGLAADAPADEEGLSEITVTGSRIQRRDLSAPSPIVTVAPEALTNSATTAIESVMQQLPQFVPAGNQFVSGAQASATTTPGAATLNLRGLGVNRNLVLLDGRRMQPANATLAIDINTIPMAALQGVEVITGGASSVYGPDALAGVTNFILKKNFEGMTVDAQTGVTAEGDGNDTRFSVLMGTNSADGRGNILLSVDWNKRGAVFQRDRDFYVDGWRDPANPGGDFMQQPTYVGTPAAGLPINNPSQAAVNTIYGRTTGAPGVGAEHRFNLDGTPFVQNLGGLGYNGPANGALDAGRNSMVNRLSNGNLDQKYITQFASTPLERYSLFMRGNYELTDNVSAFVQANYTNTTVTTRGNLAPAITVWSVPIPRDGRTLPAALNTLLDSRVQSNFTSGPQAGQPNPNTGPNAPWALFRVLDFFGPLQAQNTSNVYQVLAGLQGKAGIKDWTWEAYFSRGDTSTYSEVRTPSLQRYAQLAAAPNFGRNALITSPPTGVLAGRGYTLRCTSGLPIFQDFTPSADCLNSITTRNKTKTTLSQDVIEANLQGAAFNLPAGEARFAAGVAWRRNNFAFDPGFPEEQINDNPIGLFASNQTAGRVQVKEAYGELLAPIVKNVELELGYRVSDFQTGSQSTTEGTYKALATWKALDSVTFRGGYSFATRAPNAAEAFAGPTLLVVPFPDGDPCSVSTRSPWGNRPASNWNQPTAAANPNTAQVQALCRAIIGNNTSQFDLQTYNPVAGPNGFTRANPPFFPLEIEVQQGALANPSRPGQIKPEQGRTWTLGTVLTEPFGAERLTVTVDAYRIRVTDAIAPISSITVYNNCFNFNGTSNPTYSISNPFCQLIRRNAQTGDREEVAAVFSNLGTIETQGVDLTVDWKRDIGPGTFGFNTSLNWLDYYRYQPDPTQRQNDATGTLDQGGMFDYRLLTNLTYKWDNFDVLLNWRHLPAIDSAAVSLSPVRPQPQQGAGSYDVFGLTGSYTFGKYQIRAGIDNVLDRQPEAINLIPGIDSNTDQTNPSYYDILGRRFFVGFRANL